jgi:hypothetical protein
MIWNAAIYCTPVARDSLIVSLAEPWFTSRSQNALCILACLKDGGADREDERDVITEPTDHRPSTASCRACET